LERSMSRREFVSELYYRVIGNSNSVLQREK
jgi:hypothetical protein